MSEYIIQGETLTALADKFRSMTGSSEPITLSEMINAEVTVGQAPSGTVDRITAAINTPYQQGDPVRTAVIDPAVLTDLSFSDDGLLLGMQAGDILSLSLPLCTAYITNAFANGKLQHLDLPACTEISGMFTGCDELSYVNIPSCITIGESAFYDCDALTSINIPVCTAIGDYAFYGCSSLTSVNAPLCDVVGEHAFGQCSALTEITLPACTEIGSSAFAGCNAIETINIPLSESIGQSAFEGCSELVEIHLNTACTIESGAFDYVLDPDKKTVKFYFSGTSLGTCDEDVFGQIDYDPDTCAYGSGEDNEGERLPVPGLEIYVPDVFVDDFKTTWANGKFEKNIFPISSIESIGT